jgi:hypothetical protein
LEQVEKSIFYVQQHHNISEEIGTRQGAVWNGITYLDFRFYAELSPLACSKLNGFYFGSPI